MGGKVTVVKLAVDGKIKILPARWVSAIACDEPREFIEKFCEEVNLGKWDYGTVLEVGVAGGVGVGVETEGKVELNKRKLTAKAKFGAYGGERGTTSIGASFGYFGKE